MSDIGESPRKKPRCKLYGKETNFNMKIYIHSVLRQVHPDTRISERAMLLMNRLLAWFCDELMEIKASI